MMSLQGKIEAIIYAAEEPVTLDQLATLLKRDVLAELDAQAAAAASPTTSAEAVSSESAPSENERAAEVPPEAPTETSTGRDEPSEARQHPERAPESQEPLSVPESLAESDSPSASTSEPAAASTTGSEPTAASATVSSPAAVATKRKKAVDPDHARVKTHLRGVMEAVIATYASDDRGVEIRQIAGGYRMATKPEHHDLVRAFAKSLKPPIKLSLQALETLAIIAYKQPVTSPEIGEIRGVDSGGVVGTLLERKLITTAGRKQVIGRPIQYKTTKEFLMRFGMNDLNELPSMEEFEKLAQEQTDMFSRDVPAETGPAPSDEDVSAGDDMPEREGDYSSGANTAESVVRAQVEGSTDSGAAEAGDREGAPDSEPQRPPEEPAEPVDAGDISSGADTSETIVREQLEQGEGKR